MSRTVMFGIAILFAVVSLTLTGGQKEAEAGWGCHGGKRCRGVARCCGEEVHDDACCGRRARRCDNDCGCRGRRRRRCCGEPVDCCGTGDSSAAPAGSDPVPAAPAKEASKRMPLRVVMFR
ncbi:MAG: hypothetical protein GTO03_16310 [Planctomycetales bacterium]|nr:hypothetical protein [Planctomycetales bacterium]